MNGIIESYSTNPYRMLKLRHLLSAQVSNAEEFVIYVMLRTGLWLKGICGFHFQLGYVVKNQFQSPKGNPLGDSSF